MNSSAEPGETPSFEGGLGDATASGAPDTAGPAGDSPAAVVAATASVSTGLPAAASALSSTAASPPDEMKWYVLKVQSNRERTIRDSLLRRIRRDGLDEFFGKIVIPTEKVVETKAGKKKVTERKLYPGYIMINMVLNDETWYLVRDTGGVGDFTGAAGKPLPMRAEEIESMLKLEVQPDGKDVAPAKVKIDFARGDTVKIKEGTFESFEGSIEAVDEASGKVSVLIEIFGRSTPVELEYWQVERV